MSAMRLVLPLVLLIPTAVRADLEPAWTWKADQAVEWCRPLGEPKHSAVAVGLKDGTVQIINIITALPRLEGPIRGKPGIRPAGQDIGGGQSAGVAYFFDRYTVTAVSVTDTFDRDEPRDAVRWTVGSAADVQNREAGDPEFIEKLVAAVATPAGVAVLNSEGKLSELARDDGAIRWKADVGGGANGALLADRSTLVAVVKGKGGADAWFIDLSAPNTPPQRRSAGASEPIWQDLAREGLVAAWPGRLMMTTAEKDAARLGLKVKFPLKAALIGLHRRSAASNTAGRDLLITFDAGGDLAGHDVATGENAWRAPTRDLGPFRPARLALAGGLAILADDDGPLTAFHADTGKLAAAWTGEGCERILGVSATPRFVHALRVATRVEGMRRTRELQLIRTPIVRQGEWTKADAKAQQAAEWLGPAAGVRECVWSPGRVLVVSDKLVRMFVLPAE